MALNPLATLAQIRATPSRQDGIPAWLESDLRVYGCRLISQAGALLKQKQTPLATAQILFHRFWYVSSMKAYSIGDTAMGALFLASKLEEAPLRMRDVINVYDLLLKRAAHTPDSHSMVDGSQNDFQYSPMTYFSTTFYDLKDIIVVAEMQLLKRLGFNMSVVLPYGTLINYLKVLGLVGNEAAVSKAWGYLNDALQTPVYTLYPIPTIVSSSILLSSRFLNLPLPHDWWTLFDASWPDVWAVSGTIALLYRERRMEEVNRAKKIVLGGRKELRRWLEDHESELEAPSSQEH